jgi:hypothetical protein
MERFNDVIVAEAVVQISARAGDCDAGVAGPDLTFPDDFRSTRGPGVEQLFVRGGRTAAFGAEDLRPVAGRHRPLDAGEYNDQQKQPANDV